MYRSSFFKVFREFFDKNGLFDSYDQKLIIDETQPFIVFFDDLQENQFREYFYDSAAYMYMINRFTEKIMQIPAYLISSKRFAKEDDLRLIKQSMNYYFFDQRKSKFATEQEPLAFRKRFNGRDKMLIFVNPIKSENDDKNKGGKNDSRKFQIRKLDLSDQVGFFKALDWLAISKNGTSIFDKFISE